jgi:hypothetical protein
LAQRLHHPQSRPHRPLRIIFVCPGIAKVDEQAIAEVLRNMPLKAGDHLGTDVLIGPHHLTQILRVELTGEHSRLHQVTKQHGELTAFSVGRTCDWSSSGGRDIRHRWSLVRGVDLGRTL